MINQMVARRAGVGLAAVALVGVLGASPALALSPTSPEGEALLMSSAPKTVLIDTRTGEMTGVYAGFAPAEASTSSAVLNEWVAAQK